MYNTKKDFENKKKVPRKDGMDEKNLKSCKTTGKSGFVPRSKNPVDWYYLNEQMGKDASSLPYHVLTGMGRSLYRDIDLDYQDVTPGVMTISLTDGVGWSNTSTSTINTAIRSIYSWVRHQNSGHSNYEAPDLGIYILAMSEVYSAYAEVCRIYRVAMTYNWVNRYIPDAVLQAIGADAENIRANLAQFRAGLNIIAAKISSLAVPNNFTVFNRRDMLYSNIYLDASTERGQYYLFKKYNYRVYTPMESATGGKLTYKTLPGGAKTYQNYLDMINEMLDPILADEDMNIMSGDILKAYGRENLFVVSGLDENSTCIPVYDETILSQIENIMSLPLTVVAGQQVAGGPKLMLRIKYPTGAFDITQEDGYLVYQPRVQYTREAGSSAADTKFVFDTTLPSTVVFNSRKESPDWKDSLEGSRFMASYEYSATTDTINIDAASEIVRTINVYTNRWSRGKQAVTTSNNNITQFSNALIESTSASENWLGIPDQQFLFSAFSHHPFLYIRFGKPSIETGAVDKWSQATCPVGDYHTFAYITNNEISNLNNCALLGLFRTMLLK